ncbi:MAG TPA: hypothetical protein VFD43_00245 [Planctomycetota bacterium]|nr:hypothetical protein [Planctomycetota bacterium]
MISLTWKPEGGDKIALDLGVGAFQRVGAGCPDVYLDLHGTGATLVVANGCVEDPGKKPLGTTLSGTLRIFGAEPSLAAPRALSIRYGCAEVFRLGEASGYSPPREWASHWLRHMPEDTAEIQARLQETDFSFDDTPYTNPEVSSTSEARCCQSVWAGSLAAAMGLDQDRVRAAAEAFVDFQLRWRHYFFYLADGSPLLAHEHPWWRVGPSGWDGAVSWTSDSPYKFEAVLQHMAPDRILELAVGFNDFAGRLCANAYAEAVMTRPEYRQGSKADDQRTHGYTMNFSALLRLGRLESPARHEAMLRMVNGWRSANGTAPTGEPYASMSPSKTGKWSHGYPSLYDWTIYSKAYELHLPAPGQDPTCPSGLLPPAPGETCDHLIPWLESQAVGRGKPKTAFTFGPDGLWQGVTIVWQTAVALGGLCDLRDAGAPIDDIDDLIEHAALCIVGPGATPGGIGPTGTPITPAPIYNSYTSRHPKRVMAGGGKNGLATWIINPLLRAALVRHGSAFAAACRELAEREWKLTDYPKPPSLETTGVLPLAEFGAKA